MESQDLFDADERCDFANCLLPSRLSADIIASGKKVGGVEADSQASRFFNSIKNGGEMFDLMAKARTLPGSVFQSDPDGARFGGGEDLIQSGDNLVQRGGFARAEMGSGMHDEERQAERVGKLNFLD